MPYKAIVQGQEGQGTGKIENKQVAKLNSLRKGNGRTRRPPVNYTPSKLSSEYALDMSKAAKKKIAATERVNDVEVNLKYNNLVMVFTPASYELFRKGINGYFSAYKDNEVKSTVKLDTEGATVHESLAISSRETGKKMFTVNLFHTTSKVTVNGSQLKLFLEEDLNYILDKINQNGSLDYMNSQIKDICHKYLTKSSSKPSTRRSIDTSNKNDSNKSTVSPPKKLKLAIESTVTSDLTDSESLRADINGLSCAETSGAGILQDCCPACDKEVTDTEQGMLCESCNMWYHAVCCGIDEAEYQKLTQIEDSEFKCPNCVVTENMIVNQESEDAECPQKEKQVKVNDAVGSIHKQCNELKVVGQTTNDSEQKWSEQGISENDIAYNQKLKDLNMKEKELNKLEKTLRKKEYDTEHLSRQLTTAKALIVSLENKVVDIRKENDNLKTHLLASNSAPQGNVGHTAPYIGTPQMEMNLVVRLQTIENELLRLRLNMQESAGSVGLKSSAYERNNLFDDKLSTLESRVRALESENRTLVNRLSDTEFKLKQNENEFKLKQAVFTPGYFQTGYNLQYWPTPVEKYKNTKTETINGDGKISKGSAMKPRMPSKRQTYSRGSPGSKSVTDCYNEIAPSDDVNESVICLDGNGENLELLNQNSDTKQNENVMNLENTNHEKLSEPLVTNVTTSKKSDTSKKDFGQNQSFLSQAQPKLYPPWYQTKDSQN